MNYEGFKEAAKKAALRLKEIDNEENIKVISHLDSDGISAVSILLKALHYSNLVYSMSIVPQLDRKLLKQISNEPFNVFIFTDLGSGNVQDIEELFKGKKVFILDHHQPKKEKVDENIIHINPHLFGIDGSNEVSGAGVSYFFSRELDNRIKRMAAIAIVGAIGDAQEHNGFSELNNEILEDAIAEGTMKVEKGIKLFGYQTRALHKLLQFCSDPVIPDVTGNEKGAITFLKELGIYGNGNESKKLTEISREEVDVLVDGIIQKIGNGKKREDIMWNNYILPEEDEKHMKEVREFSTLLNACGRMEKATIGVGACLGDKEMKKKAVSILSEYKSEIMKAMEWFNDNRKKGNVIEKEGYIIINALDKIRGSIIGTLASLIAKSGKVKDEVYIMSMGHLIDGNTKISLRISGRKRREDVDLRGIMKEAIEKSGFGEYGGHKYAAGALVPTANEDSFLDIVKQVLDKRSLEEGVL